MGTSDMSILGRFKFGTTKTAVAIDLAVVPTLAVFFDEKYLPYASLTKRRPELDRLVFNKHMRKTLGHLPLDALTTQVLDDWVMEHLTKGYKPGTINKHINYLNRILNVARNWGLISGNKERTRVSRKIPMGDQRQRFLSEPEIKSVLSACRQENHPYLDLFIHLLILTGARSSEARLARWRDFDMVRMIWTVPISKNGRARRIVMSSAVTKLLVDIKGRTAALGLPFDKDSHLFINPRLKKPYESFHLAWDRARQRVGMDDVRIHDLRHTYASLLINRGASIYEVQKLLGHYHISMTERYAHLLPDTLQQRVEIVARMFDAPIADDSRRGSGW
jgi:integrase